MMRSDSGSRRLQSTGILTEREFEYLRESDALDGVSGSDYRLPEHRVAGLGHAGAFWSCQALAREKGRLTASDLCLWLGMIIRDQAAPGFGPGDALGLPSGIEGLLQGIEDALAVDDPSWTAVDATCLIADSLHAFDSIQPFPVSNGRVGRLLANYLAARTDQALIVIREVERREFIAAHASTYAMRVFVAEKIREAALFQGRMLLRTARYATADSYDIDGEQTFTCERHALVEAVEAWRGRQPSRAEQRHRTISPMG